MFKGRPTLITTYGLENVRVKVLTHSITKTETNDNVEIAVRFQNCLN